MATCGSGGHRAGLTREEFNMALNLTASNARASAPSPWAGGPFTVTFWVKRTQAYERRFTSLWSTSEVAGQRFVILNLRSEIHVPPSFSADVTGATVTHTDWNLYGATFYNVAGFDGNFITEMFVNGLGTGSPSSTRASTFSTETPTTLLIGSDIAGSIYGELAHYAFFEGELSDAQILELATKTPDSITGASPKVYYPLLSDTTNHGSGGATYDLTLLSGATLSSTNDATIPVSSSPDTAAPTLTSPSATATGATTASGSVETDEANGTLFYLASANATETDVTVKAGSSQAVTAMGEQPVTITGLTAATPYYPH